MEGVVKNSKELRTMVNKVFPMDITPLEVEVVELNDKMYVYKLFMRNGDIIDVSISEGNKLNTCIVIDGECVYKEESDTIHYDIELIKEVYLLYLNYLKENGE